jgi:hypothetical protein
MSVRHVGFMFCAAIALAGIGCAPEIGDDCGTALDCSAQGSRECDRTQPGGYCTIAGCEDGTCPSEAVCVKFRPSAERLAVTYCMYKCGDRSDCRGGYQCTSATDFGIPGDAEILGPPAQRFCSIPASMPEVTKSALEVEAAPASTRALTDAAAR